MKKIIILSNILLLLCLSCSINDDDGNCTTVPNPVIFEFVDTSGNNILKNGTLQPADIIVQEDLGNDKFTVVNSEVSRDYKLVLYNIGWYDGTKNYLVTINTDPVKTFTFTVVSNRITGNCTGYEIESIVFNNITATPEPYGHYKIIIN